MEKYSLGQFAAYNANSYGDCAYGADSCASTAASTGASTTNSGGLVNTGFMVVVIVTIACILIFAALLVRLWRRPRKLIPEPVEADNVEVIDARHGH